MELRDKVFFIHLPQADRHDIVEVSFVVDLVDSLLIDITGHQVDTQRQDLAIRPALKLMSLILDLFIFL